MKRIILVLLLFIVFSTSSVQAEDSKNYDINMKRDILCLMMAYPEYIRDIVKDESGNVYVVMKSGTRVLYDDRKNKNFNEKLFNTDIQDMMEQSYPLGSISRTMDRDFDPGRLRVYPILNEVYGKSKGEVEKNLKMANLGYNRLQFNGNNRAAVQLENAVKELMPMAQKNRDILAAMFPSSGTYNYRYISGTRLKSPHSFAIAIDLARDRRDYWKWASKVEGDTRINSYPKEIVEIFEKNNFVWGGKWSHFDILHFEYRPEIIYKSKYFGDKKTNNDKWYDGVPYKDDMVKKYIQKIDNSLN